MRRAERKNAAGLDPSANNIVNLGFEGGDAVIMGARLSCEVDEDSLALARELAVCPVTLCMLVGASPEMVPFLLDLMETLPHFGNLRAKGFGGDGFRHGRQLRCVK